MYFSWNSFLFSQAGPRRIEITVLQTTINV